MENDKKQKLELNTVTRKVILILGLTLALVVPLSQVENQITNRSEYEAFAQREVAKGWGVDVLFGSPYISVADHWHYPTTSETVISINSQEKKRGVFKVPVYTATLKTKISFAQSPSSNIKEYPTVKKMSEQDYLKFTVRPLSSLQNFKITDLTTGKELKGKLVDGGIRLSVEELPSKSFFNNQLEIEVSARGTGPLTYESNTDQDKIKMIGNWSKPKFVETIFPSESSFNSKGFEANWALNSLPNFKDGSREVKSIGLTHLWVGTDYGMIERAIKYGKLFIVLTFLLVFVVEFMSKARIHPLQYGLIGLSISVFYLLLLALSEAIGFDFAYAVSSLAVTILIGFYVRGFLNDKKFVIMILGEQIILSVFFYILLSLEERAFLIGSLGLFLALSVFMSVTRRFDWYTGTFKPQVEG